LKAAGTCFLIKFNELVKSLLNRHPGESRGPELIEIKGFRLLPEGPNLLEFDFLRDHQILGIYYLA
jgi:hypothetical protein